MVLKFISTHNRDTIYCAQILESLLNTNTLVFYELLFQTL